jgi:hypothetical protein
LPGKLSMNHSNTSVGGSVASRDTSLAKGSSPADHGCKLDGSDCAGRPLLSCTGI